MRTGEHPAETTMNNEGHFTTQDGATLYERTWPANTEALAHLVYLHGYADHCCRFKTPALSLNEANLAVHAYDQRGHGKSPGRRGFIQNFSQSVQDLEDYLDFIAKRTEGKPLFILGQSVGGLLLATLVQKRRNFATGLLFSSPYLATTDQVSPILIACAGILGKVVPFLPVQSIESNNITDNPELLRAYNDDPLIFHGKALARTGAELVRAVRDARSSFHNIHDPFYVFHSTEDQLVPIEGSQMLHAHASSTDKSFTEFSGRSHELMLDLDRDEVLANMRTWILERI